MSASNQAFLGVDAGPPAAPFTARQELKQSSHAVNHDHVGGAGGMKARRILTKGWSRHLVVSAATGRSVCTGAVCLCSRDSIE
jgi:hypothetical protein